MISARRVRDLRAEAGVNGNRETVRLCERALEGDDDAERAVEHILERLDESAEDESDFYGAHL